MEVFYSQFKHFFKTCTLALHRIGMSYHSVKFHTFSFVNSYYSIAYIIILIICNNFNLVCEDYILKNKCSHCRCVINFVFLPFFCEMFEPLLCTLAIMQHSIPQHSIAYHQTFCSNLALHSIQISQHSIHISYYSIKL